MAAELPLHLSHPAKGISTDLTCISPSTWRVFIGTRAQLRTLRPQIRDHNHLAVAATSVSGKKNAENIILDYHTMFFKLPMLWISNRYENPVSETVVTHVGAPVAWDLRIIDTSDTMMVSPCF
ncbi:hypothetical protein TNCV_1569601 [Trichonephila clavipes]|uniref:Uncharacterized protein n=1 Tax=Trichonephila clavipes TaxID=2585209 RepID=A0A8X6SP61_TRICX|nr:hypothetical protein TNCV_1569601 [Trichonephila clavipes]